MMVEYILDFSISCACESLSFFSPHKRMQLAPPVFFASVCRTYATAPRRFIVIYDIVYI